VVTGGSVVPYFPNLPPLRLGPDLAPGDRGSKASRAGAQRMGLQGTCRTGARFVLRCSRRLVNCCPEAATISHHG
jgi:hypothetical protein